VSAPGSDIFVAARGVSKHFGAVVALDGVDATLRRGEVLALAGENGSGKSTLSRILGGVIKPDAGSLTVDGEVVSFSHPRAALDAGIALVTQELTAVPSMSVAENVLLARLHSVRARVRRRDLLERAVPVLERVGLGHVDPATPFVALDPGDRGLVEVAKALAADPRLLILDEATTRLPDPELLFRLIEDLCRDGVSVVFITQRLREIRRVAQRALVLRDGRVAGELAAGELSDEHLTRLMVGRSLGGFFHKASVPPGEVVLELDGVVTERWETPVSLTVRAGEVVALAGLVGCGRSEVVETVAGVRRPRGGTVRVDGSVLTARSPVTAIRSGVGLLPEDRRSQGLVLPHSLRQNVSLGRWSALRPASRRLETRRAREAIERLRIRAPNEEAEVWTLSGGNQQKVVLARALARDPKVLLLDEPTRGVDVGAREEIYKIIGEMVSRGVAVLVVSSDLPEVLGLADRIVVLNEGAVAGELSRAEATEERIMMLAAGERAAA